MTNLGRKKAIHQLNKHNLIDELREYGATFETGWSVTELRAMLKTRRQMDPTMTEKSDLTGLTKKTLNELRALREKHHTPYNIRTGEAS